MEYPLISEYRDAIISAEDNFNELSSLRPVLDDYGNPVMSSGNFAVVFKMRDENDGKLYAVKCFIKDQYGRDESYRKIADELETVSSSYILPLRYLAKELFVDTDHCQEEEFPIVVMEWVEGETLDAYLNRNLQNKYELEMLSYRFNRMAAWLLAQPFAHGDLKPDNILVRADGSLVLVDYDGMYVPSMKGEKAREIGSPDYRHPGRTIEDFDEHIDDFSIALIALSLRAIALNPELKNNIKISEGDVLLLSEIDSRQPDRSLILYEIQKLTSNPELAMLMGVFYLAHSMHTLEGISFRLFMTRKPEVHTPVNYRYLKDTKVTEEEIKNGIKDEYGVVYSRDGKRLLKCPEGVQSYNLKPGTLVICDRAFCGCKSIQSVNLPDSVISMGDDVFFECEALQSIILPNSLTSIGCRAFYRCKALINCVLPNTITSIGDGTFSWCESIQKLSIPNSVSAIGDYAFAWCKVLSEIKLPNALLTIGDGTFIGCSSLQDVVFPDSIHSIGSNPFAECLKLSISLSARSNYLIIDELLIGRNGILISCLNHSNNILIPKEVSCIGNSAFSGCKHLQNINIPSSVRSIGERGFSDCTALKSISLPDSIKVISKGCFQGCTLLQSVDIPNSVSTIEKYAFHACNSLSELNLPPSVKQIGPWAFTCSGLKEFTIPEGVLVIEEYLFAGCTSLISVEIPKSVIRIDSCAFSECVELRKVSLPSLLKIIDSCAFEFCEALANISFPNKLEAIGNYAFFGCKGLNKIIIPDSVTKIGENCFTESAIYEALIPKALKISERDIFPYFCEVVRKN